MTAQRNPPVDTRSSPSDDSANGPVGMRNECARKSGSLHYHQPLLHDDEITTPTKLPVSKKKKQINVESMQKPRENTPVSESASMVSLERRNRLSRKKHSDDRSYCCHINLLRSGSITSAKIGILIGINYSYGFVLGGVMKKEESTVASEFHCRLDHVRKQIPDPESAKKLESVDILDSVEDNATSSKLKQTFKEAVQFDGKRYTVDPLRRK
ncbi:hypothetical protein Tsp_10476 [Trichinella spiralis]|uniref:Uncharacterized protein n=1 Tax=Trichinella spiralis TaxID=6334 RepID=E5SQK0_TRISP|nr:hypothetical protein Tsp_10476 [Trichinella spiralis]KRY34701.1 hypothetical protein T01_5967 [Trichinella spiralis]